MTLPDPDRPVGKREQNKAAKRGRILLAARELFEEQGFDNTTTAQISDRAGVGTGTLYLYVSSKEQLLFDVFAEDVGSVWTGAFAAFDDQAPLVQEIIQLFATVARYHAMQPGIAATYFLELSRVAAEADGSLSEMMDVIFDGLTEILASAQADGRLRDIVYPELLARNLFAVWNFGMVHRFSNSEITDAQAEHTQQRSLTAALAGVAT